MAINILDATDDVVAIRTATLGGEQVQVIGWAMASRSDTYTTTGNGTAVNVSTLGMSNFGLQVVETATVTSWTVVLQASLDGVNYATVLTHTKADYLSGGVIWSGANLYPALYFRSACTAITLDGGTNVIATIIGMP